MRSAPYEGLPPLLRPMGAGGEQALAAAGLAPAAAGLAAGWAAPTATAVAATRNRMRAQRSVVA